MTLMGTAFPHTVALFRPGKITVAPHVAIFGVTRYSGCMPLVYDSPPPLPVSHTIYIYVSRMIHGIPIFRKSSFYAGG